MDKSTLLAKLRDLEETLLVELLELTSAELVDRFLDKVEDKYDYIHDQLDDSEK